MTAGQTRHGSGSTLGLMALIGLVSACAVPTRVPNRTSVDARGVEAEARTFLSHYADALEGGDEKVIRALYAADDRFSWYTDGALAYSTSDDVMAARRRYADIRFETSYSNVSVVPLGASLASIRSDFETALTIPGAADYQFDGVVTMLLEKAPPSREWKVLLGHTSTPGGPPGRDGEQQR